MTSKILHLLIVEDDESHVEAIRRAYEEAGITVEIQCAGTLNEFRECMRDRQPDLVLMDMNLPDGRAMEVLTHPPEDLPFLVLVMTSFGDQQMAVDVMKAGAMDYVVKSPAAFTAMPRTVERSMREWELLQKHKRAEAKVRESEARYRMLFEDAKDGIALVDAETGRLVDCNQELCGMVERDKAEVVGQFQSILHPPEDLIEGMSHSFRQHKTENPEHSLEDQLLSKGGRLIPVEIRATRIQMNSKDFLLGIFRDITERKSAEKRELLAREVLEILNYPEDTTDTVHAILQVIKKHTGIGAIGIRLRKGNDFPYYHTEGFPEDFQEVEKYLCERDEAGKIVRDTEGNPVLECMCGNILRGRTDPSLPFFTEAGSFWSNCTTELLASTTEKDRQALTRNRCNGEGYESVALVPLRTGEEIIGLLQFNDHRKNQFTAEMIHFFEGLSTSIGIALTNKRTQEESARVLMWQNGVSLLQQSLLGPASLEQKLKNITDSIVRIFDADFCRIWLIQPGDRCEHGCVHAQIKEGPHACLYRNRCLHLLSSSGRYPHIDGKTHRRVPFGCYKIGLIASGRNHKFLTNDAPNDPCIHDHQWAQELGLISFAGYQLRVPDGQTLGVMALFAKHPITPAEDAVLDGISSTIALVIQQAKGEEEGEKLRSQLHQSQKLESIGLLAGGVAHDFNNMLSVINGYSDMLLREVPSSDPKNGIIQEISKAGKRSAEIIRQLLTFARKQVIEPKVLNLNDTVSSMLKMLQRLISENIELLWKPAANLWKVKMDPSQINQILANLLVNARDAFSGAGKVTIETGKAELDKSFCELHPDSVPGKYVVLTVSDNGAGMSKDTLTHIFEPFFTTKKVGEGTGLGLATIFGIVKQNKGIIDVYSESGKGTTFKIYLPRNEMENEQKDEKDEKDKMKTGTETVLLVEDEASLLQMAKIMLERLGYTVLVAGSPGQAIKLAGEYQEDIQLLMTDVVMPEMSGRVLQEKISLTRPSIKCLFVSGYTADVISHNGVLEKEIHFLQKPFTEEELSTKLRGVLCPSKQ